jgi:nitroreductase
MDIFEAIRQRRSCRGAFRPEPISEADLSQLLEAVRWAPSPFNVQPWELLIVRGSEGKNAIAERVEKCVVEQFKDRRFLADNSRWMRLTEAEWQEAGDGVLLTDHVNLPPILRKRPEKLRPLQKHARYLSVLGHLGAGKAPAREMADRVRTSPLLVVVLMNHTRRPPGEGAERWMWLGMGAMIQNLLLAATALKIGVQFVSAPIESQADREKIKQIFNIPPSYEVITLLRLGYVETREDRSVRLAPSAFVRYEKYE